MLVSAYRRHQQLMEAEVAGQNTKRDPEVALFADEVRISPLPSLPRELIKLLVELDQAQMDKLISDLKFRKDVRQMRSHLSKLTDDFVEQHQDQYVTVDLESGEYVLDKSSIGSAEAFEKKFGTSRRRLTGRLQDMA
jgi:hypothetical protein